MAQRVWVTGATGYLGRGVIAALRAAGHEVTALVRDPARAARLPELAGCRLAAGDVRQPRSLAGAAEGADAAVHLVGILRETRDSRFEPVVVGGTAAVLEEARRAGTRRVLYVSAIGADPAGATAYFRTKGRAEELVRASGLRWMVLRFSVVLGPGGEFLRILRRLARPLPVVPLPGHGRYLLQPVHLEDAAQAVRSALGREDAWDATHAVCGPRAYELRELLRLAAGGRRLFVPVPWPLVWWGASLLERLLPSSPVTTDQLAMLRAGSTCDPGPARAALGLEPRSVEGLLTGEER